jgi:dCTP diphosphatase
MNIKKIQQRLEDFSKIRDWEQFHNPKNLAMALSVEVSELVEIFQWSNNGGLTEIKDPKKRDRIKEEIADIFIYLIKISNKLDLDVEQIINQKIDKNEKKYPVEKSKGNSLKYTEFDE